MSDNDSEQNKKLVVEAFDVLFNQRGYDKARKLWSADYIQHSAHIPQGLDGLIGLIKTPEFKHELQLAVADGPWVFLRGRFSGHGLPRPWIVVDTVRVQDGKLAEHWDVIEDEVTQSESVSGLPMLGNTFFTET